MRTDEVNPGDARHTEVQDLCEKISLVCENHNVNSVFTAFALLIVCRAKQNGVVFDEFEKMAELFRYGMVKNWQMIDEQDRITLN